MYFLVSLSVWIILINIIGLIVVSKGEIEKMVNDLKGCRYTHQFRPGPVQRPVRPLAQAQN